MEDLPSRPMGSALVCGSEGKDENYQRKYCCAVATRCMCASTAHCEKNN